MVEFGRIIYICALLGSLADFTKLYQILQNYKKHIKSPVQTANKSLNPQSHWGFLFGEVQNEVELQELAPFLHNKICLSVYPRQRKHHKFIMQFIGVCPPIITAHPIAGFFPALA